MRPDQDPSTSSSTTTGTKSLYPPATAARVAATADVAMIARNDPVSTLTTVDVAPDMSIMLMTKDIRSDGRAP